MATRKSALLGILAIVSSLSLSSVASAQQDDWPTLKGGNARVGYNVDANGSGPGAANLRWWTPNSATNVFTTTLVVDNTDGIFTGGFANAAGSFTTNPAPNAINPWTQQNGWVANPTFFATANIDAASPWLEFDGAGNERTPAYVSSTCIKANSNDDPTHGPNGSTASSATWTFNTPATSTPMLYALYVWIPVGPQMMTTGTPPNGTVNPARYFVYKITSGQFSETQIVDTYVAAGGWVRLGNGGLPTNKVYPADSFSNQISISLYNTVPYGTDGLPVNNPPGNFLVYADAAEAVPVQGYYDASPISAQLIPGTPSTTRVVGALNQFSAGWNPGLQQFTTVASATITSYQFDTGAQAWSYKPAESNGYPIISDVAPTNSTAGWNLDPIPPAYGNEAESTQILASDNSYTQTVTYAPTLNSGTYAIYAYLPGNTGTDTFGQQVQYLIYEGNNAPNPTHVFIDQSINPGSNGLWVQIGTRRYTHDQLNAPLRVVLTNGSNLATDIGKLAYAGAVKFVGERNQTVSSTPVTATVNITGLGQKQVVVVADENGVLHCLDSQGKGDGTTTEYWSYPSYPDANGNDPNQVNGLDLGAEMPQGFSLSSALVAQPVAGGDYYLYIGTTNGRVYCIDMAGRGDYVSRAAGGTTWRVWTYPATSPSALQPVNNLGTFRGSVTTNILPTGGVASGKATIYVPTTQGRLYALDAVGTPLADGTGNPLNNQGGFTTELWQFPARNKPVLGEIWTTPVFQFGNLYFGTRVNTNDDSNGVFICLDATNYPVGGTPDVKWFYNGGTFTDAVSATTVSVNTADFLSSPAVVPFSVLYPGGIPAGVATNGGAAATDGIVYVANQNNYVYCFEANPNLPTGSPGILECNPTNELNVGVLGGISFTTMNVFDNAGVPQAAPVVMVPTLDGRFDGLFADVSITNRFGTRRAYEFNTASQSVAATMAISNNWMYGADESGFFYAFNDGTGSLSPGNPPGGQTIVENNRAGDVFRHAQLKLVTQAGYTELRKPTGQNPDYYTGTGATYSFTRTPLAFEWGERAHILVYNFPYLTTNGTSAVAPPIVNVTLSSQGKNITLQAEARLFTEPPNAPDDQADPNYPNGTERDNGYAILEFTFGSGNMALPPGNGTISISISTAALNTFGALQTVALNPRSSRLPFFMANPLALAMPGNTNQNYDAIGMTVSPSDPEALVNGSPKLPGTAKKENLLAASGGIANHGSSTTVQVQLVDRSMMATIHPLSGVHMDVHNLGWQGGRAAIWKPLNPAYYVNFEDYPDNYPNTSIDYPDIQSMQIQVVSNVNGTAENPRYQKGVELLPPTVTVGGVTRPMQLGDDPSTRNLVPTPTDITINVPRFQPPNSNFQLGNIPGSPLVSNSDPTATINPDQGYFGRMRVWVNTNSNTLPITGSLQAYRGFNLMTSVGIDEKLSVSTPTVALGTLAQGAAYDPNRPGSDYNPASNVTNPAPVFQPWGGNLFRMFQPFVANNEGNVNLLNVRLAKAYQTAQGNPPTVPGSPISWPIFATGNDLLGWLDGSLDLWSDIDATFAPEGGGPGRPVAVPKARVGDGAPSTLTANTVQRANANLGTTGFFTPAGQATPLQAVLNSTLIGNPGAKTLKYPPISPRVAVSIPLGMPVGQYSQIMRVIEKNSSNEIWQMANGAPETFSDPTFTASFTVRESRMTGYFTPGTATMVDGDPSKQPTPGNPLAYSNLQPAMVRDPFGSMIVAWSSDRPNWNPTIPTAATQLGNYSLYIATVGNSATFGSFGVGGTLDSSSPLADLDSFVPTGSQWFKEQVAAYPPQAPDLLFGSLAGETVIPGTVQYGNPSFPQAGLSNPYNPAVTFNGMFMPFTGSAQTQTPSGRVGKSLLFMTVVQPAGGTVSNPAQPIPLLADPLVTKGKPSVVQSSRGAMVFYPGTSGGQSSVYYTFFNGSAFGNPVALPFGSGFQSVSGVSASARIYTGAGSFRSDGVTPMLRGGDDVVDLTFTGQMQGRPNAEVFLGRMKVDSSNFVVIDDNGVAIDNPASDGNVFLPLSQQSNEVLVAGSQPGLYRSMGVMWDATAAIQIRQILNGVPAPLLVNGSANYDRATGIVTYDSNLGGKVYIDTTLGTVRFSAGVPNRNAMILATYTPRFLRISATGGAAYTKPTGLFDHREVSNPTYWRRPLGAQADYTDDIKSDRFLFTYNRAAGGAGLPARPYMTSLRFGVQLPYRIATDGNGVPINVRVTGVIQGIGAYQIDPASAKIYFTGADEDNQVNVSYTAVSESGGVSNVGPYRLNVSLVREGIYQPTAVTPLGNLTLAAQGLEQPILIDNALNESDLTAFLDPYSYVPGPARRPPLTWLFWTSSRAGVPDIFFETISPQWSPIAVSQ